MGQTLLVEENETLSMIYSLNLKMYAGTDVVTKKDYKEAIELLRHHDAVDLIIARGKNAENIRPSMEIYRFLKNEDRYIPIIVIGDDSLLEKHCIMLPESVSLKDIVSTVAKCLGITPKQMTMNEVPDLYPIPILYFINSYGVPCDVMLKMNTQEGIRYIKRFTQGDEVLLEDIEKLIKKGIKTLYIPKDHRLTFVNNVTERLTKQLYSDKISDEERVKATNSSIEIVKNQLQTAGLAQETIELAKASMDSVKKIVKASPVLKTLLEQMLKSTGSFHYRHVQLCTYFSFHALSNLEWGTDEHRDKIAFVTYFHDITLTTDEMVKIHTDDDLKNAKLTEQERLIVQTHALEASKLIQSYPRSPFGAEQIIKQHHGSMTGTGIAKNFSNNLSPLAIVFIVCEELVHLVLNASSISAFDRGKAMVHLNKKFPKSMYQKVIKTFENLEL